MQTGESSVSELNLIKIDLKEKNHVHKISKMKADFQINCTGKGMSIVLIGM